MREMDFSESNLGNRWLGVKEIWNDIQGEVKRFIKFRLERAMVLDQSVQVGCGSYGRSEDRRGYRNGSYVRDLLTSYWWIEDLSLRYWRDIDVVNVRWTGFCWRLFYWDIQLGKPGDCLRVYLGIILVPRRYPTLSRS